MEFTVFRDQENANNVLRNKENNVPPRDQQPSKRRSVLGVLNAKQPFTKKPQPKSKAQGTNKFGFPNKSSVPFTIHEDPQVNKKAAASENLSRNNVENQKPLLLKNETNISEAKATLPKIELLKERRKPLSDVSQIVAPSVKNEVKIDDKDIKDIDESADSSNVYSPMSIDNDKSIQSTSHSMTAHRLSCDVDTYTCELYSYLRDVEKLHRPKPGYMRRQPDVTYSMRAILVDWLVEVAQEYKLQNETLYLAVSFIDRFLSLMSVVRAKLQLLGTAAMFVASKYEEIYPPDVSEFVYITDDTYTKKQVLKMEQLILKVLGFDVSNPTTVIFLTRADLEHAAVAVAKYAQRVTFGNMFSDLLHNRPICIKPVARLRPFIDQRGLICVGGRLSNSDLPETQKHPILLGKLSHLSTLLIRHWHEVTGHGGPRILTSLINRTYWILSLNTLIRSVLCKCVTCVRLASVNPQPIMSDLPTSRVSECPPFSRVGIDFAGPLVMTEHRLRKARQFKVYIAVFVCFTVKAVHLEYVSDLTTDAFLAALQRFVARRGLPTDIYTDCGTNFVGASNQLRALVNAPGCQDSLVSRFHCTWHFNPPGAPHFGGLWEAAVRSAKHLMVRIMGEHTFSLEELCTMLCRIEAILNSRPLVQLSPDPAEYDCLTPGHFLIGRPLLSIPEVPIENTARPLVQRWKLLNQCAQSFWHRWRDEYLNTLQTRNRWTTDAPNISVNDMVIIKEPNVPPLRWHMARIEEVFPGADGVVRVVRLRTATGILTRPVVKIVKLPSA